MIVHISKNAKGLYIAMSSTLEIAKLHQGTAQVVKVDTDQLTDSLSTFLEFMELIGVTRKGVIEGIVATRLDAQPADTSNWHPCAPYGDGEWVVYKGRRMYAVGTGNIPSSREG